MIINGDDREAVIDLSVRPHAATCLIQTRYDRYAGVVGFGTGFLVGPGRLATAAHVLWNNVDGRTKQTKRLPDTIEVFLGEGLFASNPQLTWTLRPDPGNNPAHPDFVAGNRDSDVAKLTIPDTSRAPLAMLGFPANLAAGEAVAVGGYPTQKQPFGHYESTGPLATLNVPVFQHQVDTTHGQSGAPVRVQRNGGWSVIGVHLGDDAVSAGGAPMNRALALTPAIMTWLLA